MAEQAEQAEQVEQGGTGPTVAHPLVDDYGDGFVVTESRARAVFLESGRVNLLRMATEAGLRVVLVTDELSALTPAFVEVWRAGGAAWVVRSADGGLREGFTGRRLTEVASVLHASPVRDVDDLAIGHLRGGVADAMEVVVTTSLRHRARSTTLLGGPADALCRLGTGGPPRGWGPHEPAGALWSREGLTRFAREQMPADTLSVATAAGFAATITARRTSHGVEEITTAHLSLAAPSTPVFETHRRGLLRFFTELAVTSMPLIGLALARPGRRDLLTGPVIAAPPTALALMIGPPGVRALGLSVAEMDTRFGAIVVGRPRIPGLLFDLGTMGEPTWARLDAVLSAVDPDRLAAMLAPHQAATVAAARTAGPAATAEHPRKRG